MASWILQGNPKRWSLDTCFGDVAEHRAGPFTVWRVEQFTEDLEFHDGVFFWRAGMGKRPGIAAVGQVLAHEKPAGYPP